jgi:hypothetical protein
MERKCKFSYEIMQNNVMTTLLSLRRLAVTNVSFYLGICTRDKNDSCKKLFFTLTIKILRVVNGYNILPDKFNLV